MLPNVIILKAVTLDGETYVLGHGMNWTKKQSVLKSVFGRMPLLHVAIWVWTALCQLLLFTLKSLFFPLHAIRE